MERKEIETLYSYLNSMDLNVMAMGVELIKQHYKDWDLSETKYTLKNDSLFDNFHYNLHNETGRVHINYLTEVFSITNKGLLKIYDARKIYPLKDFNSIIVW